MMQLILFLFQACTMDHTSRKVRQNLIITLQDPKFDSSLSLDSNLQTISQDSLAVTNPEPGTGGGGAETLMFMPGLFSIDPRP